ncbi:hypothetical protein O0544_11415 [Edwardsiella anguillarum]|nr:hypothetical protein [Edwardsiella anguillarum]
MACWSTTGKIQSLYDTLYHAMQDSRPLHEVLFARWGGNVPA